MHKIVDGKTIPLDEAERAAIASVTPEELDERRKKRERVMEQRNAASPSA